MTRRTGWLVNEREKDVDNDLGENEREPGSFSVGSPAFS
jgi:hypothetical protein